MKLKLIVNEKTFLMGINPESWSESAKFYKLRHLSKELFSCKSEVEESTLFNNQSINWPRWPIKRMCWFPLKLLRSPNNNNSLKLPRSSRPDRGSSRRWSGSSGSRPRGSGGWTRRRPRSGGGGSRSPEARERAKERRRTTRRERLPKEGRKGGLPREGEGRNTSTKATKRPKRPPKERNSSQSKSTSNEEAISSDKICDEF